MLRVFFREFDSVVSSSENYSIPISLDDTDKLYEFAKSMKADIENTPIEEIFENFLVHLNNANKDGNNSN